MGSWVLLEPKSGQFDHGLDTFYTMTGREMSHKWTDGSAEPAFGASKPALRAAREPVADRDRITLTKGGS